MAERRWVVLGGDGRHVSVGRYTDPSEEEIQRMEQDLHSQGLTGWLAIVSGDYYGPGQIEIVQVRPLVVPQDDREGDMDADLWSTAVARFREFRAAMNKGG